MSYLENMQDIVRQYQAAGLSWPATARTVAFWAIEQGLWKPQPSDVVDQCAGHLARAMREEYITDPQGRHVRAKHAAKFKKDGEQLVLWADIRTAPREHMERAFQQRRRQIVADCSQLKLDVDSYNENNNKAEAIQLVFDFTLDLEELELAVA